METERQKYNIINSMDDLKKWYKNPEIHPINGKTMHIMSEEYYDVYESAYKLLMEDKIFSTIGDDDYIIEILPKNHLLFEDIDLVRYRCVKNLVPSFKKLYNDVNIEIILFLTENIEKNNLELENKSTKLEIEIEILRNRFTDNLNTSYNSNKNFSNVKKIFSMFKKSLIELFLTKDYFTIYEYPDSIDNLIIDNNYYIFYWYMKFIEKIKLSNGVLIIKYFINSIKTPNYPQWIISFLKLYNEYKGLFKDIDDCFNPESGIIENVEDKKLNTIKDPIDSYFEKFETKLNEIKKKKYSQLIDPSTFKAKNIKKLDYLNDEDYNVFKIHKDNYDSARKKYESELLKYESNPSGSSPTPPKKPTITLPSSGKTITIAVQKDPMHIKDNVIESFKIEYEKIKSVIEEYNEVKQMSYIELKRYFGEDITTAENQLISNNELMSMDKEKINNIILYDNNEPGLNDKCSEEIDVFTNEYFKDNDYPLSKLQLMVRLKVYTSDKQTYRTECIYAPVLYNNLILCINNKTPFKNPITNTKYTTEHIKELMKVIKIIDPSLEVPKFIKHRNDTELKIGYRTYLYKILNFTTIYLYRDIGDESYHIYDICTIPADIEATGLYATNSTDITSSVMLFRIIKLFNDGRLLHKYIPPYCIPVSNRPNTYQYIKLGIHFNNYRTADNWLYNSATGASRNKIELLELFKSRATEINNFI